MKRNKLSIQKVEMKRKERHEYIVKEIDLRMNDLNDVIEQEIRREAANVTASIQMIKEKVEQIMATVKEKVGYVRKGKRVPKFSVRKFINVLLLFGLFR